MRRLRTLAMAALLGAVTPGLAGATPVASLTLLGGQDPLALEVGQVYGAAIYVDDLAAGETILSLTGTATPSQAAIDVTGQFSYDGPFLPGDPAEIVPFEFLGAGSGYIAIQETLTTSFQAVPQTLTIELAASAPPGGGPAVPEPTSVFLAAIGAVGLAGYAWRRKSQAGRA